MAVIYLGTGFSPTSITMIEKPSLGWTWPAVAHVYFMRAVNSIGNKVMWVANSVDALGVQSSDPNKPFSDVVILDVWS